MLALISEGSSNKEAANILGISNRTVEAHRARIMKKLKVFFRFFTYFIIFVLHYLFDITNKSIEKIHLNTFDTIYVHLCRSS